MTLHAIVDTFGQFDPVFAGAGPAVAVALLLALFLLLPPGERAFLRAPTVMLLGFLALTTADRLIAGFFPDHGVIHLIAMFLLLAGIGRSGFLLVVNGFWVPRRGLPLPKILQDVMQAGVYAAATLPVLRAAGVEPRSLLTTSAVLTAVLGLSLQDTLGNLFAGLAIQAQRPFEVGDWIRFDSRENAVGRVVEINWRATRLQTLALVEITVPNAAAAKAHILNYTKPTRLVRQDVRMLAPYDVSPDRVHRFVLHALRHTTDVLESPAPCVVCKSYDESGVVYEVRYFIDNFERHEFIESDVRERVWYALCREGLAFPVPGRRVELREVPAAEATSTKAASFRHQLLLRLDLFEGLSEEELLRLADQGRHEAYAQNELIMRQGDPGSDMYVIERGRVRFESRVEGSPSHLIGVLERGEFFGEMAMLTGEPRVADAIAETETEVLVLSRDSIAPILSVNPVLAERISGVLAERQARLEAARGASLRSDATPPASGQDEILRRIRRFFRLG